jgi:hypothetical protein
VYKRQQQWSEQIKAVQTIINPTSIQLNPTSIQQWSEQMKAVEKIINPTLGQKMIEQMRAVENSIKPTAVQQLIEQINVVGDNSKYHIEIPIQKQISQITKDGTPEKENSQKIDTQASNNEPTTLPILDRPQEDTEQD